MHLRKMIMCRKKRATEDYNLIEHLPQELRDRFTEMREMDLTVQNNIDSLEKRVKNFFGGCRRGEFVGQQADNEFSIIRRDYYHALEDADEKVQLANQMYDLVEKYLRKLDSELHKFKCELEADHNGITEVLEKRSLELDVPQQLPSNPQKENRPRAEKRRDSTSSVRADCMPLEKRHSSHATSSPASSQSNIAAIQNSTPGSSSTGYTLQHIGAGNAIAAAASQAITATQQMQQGRRTASLKASYEAAIHLGTSGGATSGHELLIGRDLAGAAQTALQAVEREGTTGHRRQKKKYNNNSSISHSIIGGTSHSNSSMGSAGSSSGIAPINNTHTHAVESVDNGTEVDDAAALDANQEEWTYDPNEPKYCLCNQVSYGDMVACDNEDCPFEWFHYPCVGIEAPPKGKWYCPQCISSMRRRGSRKA
ncbi:inhibitor of growth protein 3 isoform X2 [Ctenocephalides felis]|uniref:inhibitor of growth protein 3 isoform X2 n=1 Tax=Ctenocephalides felis TaxID=7515 RepID=UPI000E6E2962|nr:inhibitor of growth protein 3 isoform X2 [Ctenocephalides felis]